MLTHITSCSCHAHWGEGVPLHSHPRSMSKGLVMQTGIPKRNRETAIPLRKSDFLFLPGVGYVTVIPASRKLGEEDYQELEAARDIERAFQARVSYSTNHNLKPTTTKMLWWSRTTLLTEHSSRIWLAKLPSCPDSKSQGTKHSRSPGTWLSSPHCSAP